jgi:hypothetical protein
MCSGLAQAVNLLCIVLLKHQAGLFAHDAAVLSVLLMTIRE